MNNKELRVLSLLTKQNVTLEKQESELTMSELDKRVCVLDAILAAKTTCTLGEGTTSQEDSTTSSDVNSTGDEEDRVITCPHSPTKRKRSQNNHDDTPSVTKKQDTQKNDSQRGFGGEDTIVSQIVDDTRSKILGVKTTVTSSEGTTSQEESATYHDNTPPVTKKKDSQKNDSQRNSGGEDAVELQIVSRRRSRRVRKKSSDK